ncbi:MAG: Holliday junction resolvase RuvX [Anaerolineae bacterium]
MRYLALDLGERRIGLAISDATGLLARPLTVLKRASRAADFAHIARLIEEHEVDALVVGLPLNMDDTEGPQAAWARDYSAALARAVERPVHLWDERLSTEKAQEIIHQQGKTVRQTKDRIDAVAAAVILQDFLERGQRERPGYELGVES